MRVYDPSTIDEALRIRATHPNAVAIAGGTDLLAAWSTGVPRPARMLVLSNIQELTGIELLDKGSRSSISIGACTTVSKILTDNIINQFLPALTQAARGVGAPAVRNMGTIGGNLVTASPAADLPPALMIFDANIIVISAARGKRSIPVNQFFKNYRETLLEPDELVFKVCIPVPDDYIHSYFRKEGARNAQACSKASLAVACAMDLDRISHIRIAASSVAPTPIRLGETEKMLTGQIVSSDLLERAANRASSEISPIDDVRSTAEYRRLITSTMLTQALRILCDV